MLLEKRTPSCNERLDVYPLQARTVGAAGIQTTVEERLHRGRSARQSRALTKCTVLRISAMRNTRRSRIRRARSSG